MNKALRSLTIYTLWRCWCQLHQLRYLKKWSATKRYVTPFKKNKSVPNSSQEWVGKGVDISGSCHWILFLALSALQYRRFTWLVIPGHQTDAFAQSKHFCTPRWPVWIFMRVSVCRDEGITIHEPYSNRLSVIGNLRLAPQYECNCF